MDGEGDESGTHLRTRSARLKAAESSPPAPSNTNSTTTTTTTEDDLIDGRKPSLPKQINGLGISNNENGNPLNIAGVYDLATETVDEMLDDEKDTILRSDDLKKLNVVIRAFAPDLLRLRNQQHSPSQANIAEGSDPRKRGAERRAAKASDSTLDDLLSQPKLSARQLHDHLIKLRSPLITPSALRAHLSGSHAIPSRDNIDSDRSKLAAISTCLALVDEIAKISGGERVGQYALQMRLPGGDYFTNAISMSDKEMEEVDPAYAHIVDISSYRLAPKSQSIPTLGERLFDTLRPKRQRREEDDYAKPVSNLYYGPWASFGPTYDSFDGQLTHKTSNALWRAKRDENVEFHRWANSKPSLLGMEARERFEEDVEEDDNLDVDLMMEGYDALPDFDLDENQKSIDELLERNSTLLLWLQNLQEQRWRQLMGKSQINGIVQLSEPDQNEQKIAQSLLKSLTSLLSARPPGIIPTPDKLQLDPALPTGYWGTLDSTLFGPEATRRQALSRSIPLAAIRDNETLRLSGETEGKAENQTMSLGATVLGANRDRGKGLLDRFAGSRKYQLTDHPHDRKPPIPPAPVRPPMPNASANSAAPNTSSANKPPFSSPQHTFGRPAPHHPHPQQQHHLHQQRSRPSSYAKPSPLASSIPPYRAM